MPKMRKMAIRKRKRNKRRISQLNRSRNLRKKKRRSE